MARGRGSSNNNSRNTSKHRSKHTINKKRKTFNPKSKRKKFNDQNEKQSKIEPNIIPKESSSESEDDFANPLKDLLNTFSTQHQQLNNDDMDDSDSSESNAEDEKMNLAENSEENLELSEEEEEDVLIDDELNTNDPFMQHLNFDLSDELLNSLENNQRSTHNIEWPELGKLEVMIPTPGDEPQKIKNTTIIEEEKTYATPGNIPKQQTKLDFNQLHIKSQIHENILDANQEPLTELQRELFSIVNNYQDLFCNERTFENGEEIRFIYTLHAINHILKTRTKILHHNARLNAKSNKSEIPNEFRDQGLTRPKVLIVVPFRDSVLKIVHLLENILVPGNSGQVINKIRFLEDFSGNELLMPKKNPKPEDYELTFTGNCDDTFKIGIQVTKKSLKLYADFYSSDIIIASPLGLRLTIGAEGEPERDYDFLASIELLIFDQIELFLMQNWDHVLHLLNHLHMQPKQSHGTDFGRVRNWTLNGWSKYYRQTLLFSSLVLPEINSMFNKKCFNYRGRVKQNNFTCIANGSIVNIHVQVPQVYRQFQTDTIAEATDKRFQFFTSKILPHYKDSIMKQCLIYVPNYFDYVQIRNYLKREDISFVQICEYSKDGKIARARDMFFHGDAQFLLYSERFHFFRRIRLKGIRHVIFYQPPTFPHFYSEIVNSMQETNQNKKCGSASNMTVTVLYSKYDGHQMAAILGTERFTRMATSNQTFHMITSNSK